MELSVDHPVILIEGLAWPETLGDFKLMGPVNRLGSWRWYERQINEMTERVKVDGRLQFVESKLVQ